MERHHACFASIIAPAFFLKVILSRKVRESMFCSQKQNRRMEQNLSIFNFRPLAATKHCRAELTKKGSEAMQKFFPPRFMK